MTVIRRKLAISKIVIEDYEQAVIIRAALNGLLKRFEKKRPNDLYRQMISIGLIQKFNNGLK